MTSRPEVIAAVDSLWDAAYARAVTDLSPATSEYEHLPLLVREKRRRLGLSLRQLAGLVGVSGATIHRCEQGQDVSLANAVRLVRWVRE